MNKITIEQSEWTAKVYDGLIEGTDYSYSPHVSISDRSGKFIASVNLTSIGYSGTEADRLKDEDNARLITAAPELRAFLVTLLFAPALSDVEKRRGNFFSDQPDPFKDARALLKWIDGTE